MKIQLKKQNRHQPESVNQTGIQAKSLTDIRPMDNHLAAPQKPQTEDINHQQIQKKQGFNFAEIPITGNTDGSPSRIQPKFNLPLQKKLTVGEAGDKYEQEADSVAEKVVKKINTPSGEQPTSGQGVQRQGEEEEDLQMKPDISSIQRQEGEEEEIQAKSTQLDQQVMAGGDASTELETTIQSAKSVGSPLDAGLQQKMGKAMGADFSGVKVHTDSQSDKLNRSLSSRAFATGPNLFFKQGEYNPGSRSGQELIAHELTHVVQQNGGAVQRKSHSDGETTGDKYEQEADRVVAKVVQQVNSPASQSPQGQSVQREGEEEIQGEPEITSQEPRGAVVESTLTPEEITYLQKFRDVANILKFNFAGSGEEAWKTHKEKYAKPGKEQMGSAEHLSGGKKYSKEKQTLDKDKTVFEYAGPISKLLGKKGLKDSGENSTQENLADAQREFNDYMSKYRIAKGRFSEIPKVQINIKGFSRGAATASVFASWIKSTMFKDVVDVNLVLIDPVHGTGFLAKGLMPSEQDVSGVYDEENAPDTSGTTYLMPIESGHSSNYFTPQKISGYQRLIIGYGPGIKHSFGLGESEDSTLKYNGQPVKGMKLSTLPKGLFVVNAADMNIVKVPNMETWKSDFEDLVLGKANKKEKRDVVIREALSALDQYF